MPKFSETSAKTVGDIFHDNKSISVPNYQRNYSWTSNENDKEGCKVCDLWNDLVEKFNDFNKDPTNVENGEYLLGPMVFVQKDNRNIEIVDGQQRLATLTILFCAARDIILELQPDMPYADMAEIHKIIENANLAGQGLTRSWDSWKLKLNQVDNMQFEKYIQQYIVKDPPNQDILDNKGDKYYKNSKKVKYFNSEIKKKNDYSDSEILLFQAYVEISNRITNALILNFDSKLEVELRLEEIKKQAEEDVKKNIEKDPVKYLGSDNRDFFSKIDEGLNDFLKKSWSDEKKKKLQDELDKKNAKLKTKGENEQNFDDFIEWKIKHLKTKKLGSQGSYQTIITDETEKEISNITKSQKIYHIPKLIAFCAGITEQITNVRIKVKEEEDAYQIFESLNDKGQNLSKSNLIKNLIIKTISGESAKGRWSLKWDNMITSITKEGIDPDKFLRLSLLSRGYLDPTSNTYRFAEFPLPNNKTTRVTTNNFYRVVKAKIKDENHATNYIEQLEKDAKICIQLNSPKDKFPDSPSQKIHQNRDPKPAIIDLGYLDAEYFLIPVLCAYRKWKPDSDEFTLLVKFLTVFFFRYKIVRKKAVSILEQISLTASEIIENGQDRDKLKNLNKIIKFALQYDDSTHFENQFEYSFDPPSKTNARFVLKHIESFLEKKTDDTVPMDKLQIEHILPEDPLTSSTVPEENWDKVDFFNGYTSEPGGLQKEFSSWHKRLGNLSLLNDIVNPKVSNYSFLIKLDHKDEGMNFDGYRSSKLRINQETVVKEEETNQDRAKWTWESIHKRGMYLKKLSIGIWELPRIVCESTSCVNHDVHHKIEGTVEKVETKKCDECKNELTIRWPDSAGPEYLAADTYRS